MCGKIEHPASDRVKRQSCFGQRPLIQSLLRISQKMQLLTAKLSKLYPLYAAAIAAAAKSLEKAFRGLSRTLTHAKCFSWSIWPSRKSLVRDTCLPLSKATLPTFLVIGKEIWPFKFKDPVFIWICQDTTENKCPK